jgi:hypothetical protein
MFLFPSLDMEDTISETTAVRWLKKLGFKLSRVQKGVYVDGHEYVDVVDAHRIYGKGNISVSLNLTVHIHALISFKKVLLYL